MNARGDAVAAWEEASADSFSVMGPLRPAGQAWQAPASISPPVKHGGLFPQVTIDARGDALAAWALDDEGRYLVQAGADENGEELLPRSGTLQARERPGAGRRAPDAMGGSCDCTLTARPSRAWAVSSYES
jgi:hypothetical protein